MDLFWNALTLEQREARHREYPWWLEAHVGHRVARSGYRVVEWGSPSLFLVVPPALSVHLTMFCVDHERELKPGVEFYRSAGFPLCGVPNLTDTEPRTLAELLLDVSRRFPDPVPEPMAGDVWGLESGETVQIGKVVPLKAEGTWHINFGQGTRAFALETRSKDGRSILGAKWPPRILGKPKVLHWARLRPEPWCPPEWLT